MSSWTDRIDPLSIRSRITVTSVGLRYWLAIWKENGEIRQGVFSWDVVVLAAAVAKVSIRITGVHHDVILSPPLSIGGKRRKKTVAEEFAEAWEKLKRQWRKEDKMKKLAGDRGISLNGGRQLKLLD